MSSSLGVADGILPLIDPFWPVLNVSGATIGATVGATVGRVPWVPVAFAGSCFQVEEKGKSGNASTAPATSSNLGAV